MTARPLYLPGPVPAFREGSGEVWMLGHTIAGLPPRLAQCLHQALTFSFPFPSATGLPAHAVLSPLFKAVCCQCWTRRHGRRLVRPDSSQCLQYSVLINFRLRQKYLHVYFSSLHAQGLLLGFALGSLPWQCTCSVSTTVWARRFCRFNSAGESSMEPTSNGC